MTLKFKVVEHYPDGTSSGIAIFATEAEAKGYIKRRCFYNCTVQPCYIMTIK